MSSFNKFYETWFDHLNQLVQQLSTAPKPPTTEEQHKHLDDLVTQTMTHYAEYYRVKSESVERDVFNIFTAPWASTLERSLHWITGWRPTTVFHLVYTESSIMFESNIMDILRGLRTGDLGDLSPSQFRQVHYIYVLLLWNVYRRVSEMQCETVKEENKITSEMSAWQDDATELLTASSEFDLMIERLVIVVHKADDLRLRTLKKMVDMLTTRQAVEFLVAAAELQFGVRLWGRNIDRPRVTA
ncbi:hypothetical protein LWI29_032519 [Acer saccharum]|uniref:DOG1 domain-containing protein n=1 Tax=Acer saccharum TaxID=4024 RepID=A0AA39T057_ACESA|nr:hypothetical protein LWI29_032519 [Acer saccharum]KAK1583032.1 hypothetical protein Q3G72_020443 [Acer saccharum]